MKRMLFFLLLFPSTLLAQISIGVKAGLNFANVTSTAGFNNSNRTGYMVGGFGSAILEFMNQHNYKAEIKILGIPDKIVEHGTPKELQRECGYDAQAVIDAVRNLIKEKIQVTTIG